MSFYAGNTPIDLLIRSGTRAEAGMLASIGQIRALPGSRWPVGYESAMLRQGVGRIDMMTVPLRSVEAMAIRFDQSARIEHLLERRPSELAAWRLWNMLDAGNISPTDLQDLSRLLGGGTQFRSERIGTTRFPSGHWIEFLRPDHIAARVSQLLTRINEPVDADPIVEATTTFFDMLCIHPFPDGNGRLARLFFQGTLRRRIGLPIPVLPLGPACALNRGNLIRCYLAWHYDLNAGALFDFVSSTLNVLIERSFALEKAMR